ncbi:MAG: RNA polymerase sigma factor [Gemmatimonadaceae bacterium]
MAESAAVQRTIEAIWRIESARLIASVARLVRDVGVAEDLAQDAFVAALEQWPESGVPDNPGAWLMAAAKRKAIDHLRRRQTFDRKETQIVHDIESRDADADIHDTIDDDVGDDLLRLIFTACHPVLSTDARTALTLRLLGGLTTAEIARAYLTSEATIQQRIVRAKRTLTEAQVRFELPRADERMARLASVLEVIYLIFNEGYQATEGDRLIRHELCDEALRLGRILAGMVPDEPEVHGLVALLEIQASRLRARVGPSGEPILLLDQDRARWDRVLIRRGLDALDRAVALGKPLGPYALQASITACHARANVASETDWERIVALYDALAQITQSPVIELNRAVAVSMALGAAAGLEMVEELSEEITLAKYHLLHAVRGDLLEKLGRRDEARAAFDAAASLTRNERERELLAARARANAEPRRHLTST